MPGMLLENKAKLSTKGREACRCELVEVVWGMHRAEIGHKAVADQPIIAIQQLMK